MDISLIAAKVLGVYLVISGLFLVFRKKTVPNLLKDFFDHPAIVYLTGTILVFLSLILLFQNNVWDGSWRMVITIFAWLVLAKGIAYIFVPNALRKLINKRLFGSSLNFFGLMAIIAGIALFFLV